jgi:hypothetical protein
MAKSPTLLNRMSKSCGGLLLIRLDKPMHLTRCATLSKTFLSATKGITGVNSTKSGGFGHGQPDRFAQQSSSNTGFGQPPSFRQDASAVGGFGGWGGGQQQQRQQGFGQFPVQNGGFSSATGFEGQTMPTS